MAVMDSRQSVPSRKRIARSKGATRKVVKPSRTIEVPWLPIMLVMMILIIAYLLTRLDLQNFYQTVDSAVERPVAKIEIDGEFNMLTHDYVSSRIRDHVRGDFVDIDIRLLKRGQKEVIIDCGKQYRFVVDFDAAIEK